MDYRLLALYAFFGALGFAAHLLKTMKQVNWQKPIVEYFTAYPRITATAFIGFVAAMASVYEMGQLNMTSAFACGYMANSAADTIAGRTIKQLR